MPPLDLMGQGKAVFLSLKSMKKLASLSALGAGAVALTSEKAEASIIYSGPMDQKVGVDSSLGYLPSYTSPALPNGAELQFSVQKTAGSGINLTYMNVQRAGPGTLRFENFISTFKFLTSSVSTSVLKIVNKGAVWTASHPQSSLILAGRFWPRPNLQFGDTNFADEYALFHFNGGGNSGCCYGWVELSFNMIQTPLPPRPGSGPGSTGQNGPNLDILGYAYDDTGALIPAGYTGPESLPEPSTVELTGLGALALGAEGLRRWRKARKA
jgi:hypothetical protein